MKILQINSVCGVGSTGRIVLDIHKILLSQGHERFIAYGRGNTRDITNTIRIGSKFNNYMHAISTRLFDNHGFASKLATKKFIQRLQNINPDLIHIHNLHGYYLNIEILFNYLKLTKKPVIWTLHDCWAFTGHCAYFDYVGCNKWRTGCHTCPQSNEYPKSWLIDNSKRNYAKKKELINSLDNLTIISPSNWLSELVKDSYLKKFPIKVINNGIDLEKFKPTESNFRENYELKDKFIILGVANIWNARKGLKYFMELSNKIREDEALVIVGLTKKQSKNLPSNIVPILRTNSISELAEIYSSANVYFNPTLEDNFPTTNLESLACGTPVVTFETGGSTESVDCGSGYIVRIGNLQSALIAFRDIFDRNRFRVDLSSRERAVKLYNMFDRYNDYIYLYRSKTIESLYDTNK
jgi:glycosyltransferase involved in cell wall biosynthesis